MYAIVTFLPRRAGFARWFSRVHYYIIKGSSTIWSDGTMPRISPCVHIGCGRPLTIPTRTLQSRRCTSVKSGNNILQMVVWESFFFNQVVSWSKITRLWAVLIKRWLSKACEFYGILASPFCGFRVAVTVQSRCRYGAIALRLLMPLAFARVQSRCRYGAIALPLRWNGDAIAL